MYLIDIHTHCLNSNKEVISIINGLDDGLAPIPGYYYSLGLHPWAIKDNPEKIIEQLFIAAKEKNVVAIGECGLDVINSSADMGVQLNVFTAHIELSEQLRKPLIIHQVRQEQQISHLRKTIAPTQAWIIHGFRGKPTIAKQLINAGCYLSFGLKFNEETLLSVPHDRIFLETDIACIDIKTHYSKVAALLNIDIKSLSHRISQNANECSLLIPNEVVLKPNLNNFI